jgi:hypothetical protein
MINVGASPRVCPILQDSEYFNVNLNKKIK